MPIVPSEYWVRVRVTGAESGVSTYHSALDLADKLAHQNPGLTFEIAEDKVWASVRTKEESNGTQELQDT